VSWLRRDSSQRRGPHHKAPESVPDEIGGHVAGDHGVQQEQEEELVVEEPDAVCHPGAIVVHFKYTFVEGGAMVRPVRLVHLAHFVAEPTGIRRGRVYIRRRG
jgi:hypothetical protein